MKTEDEGDACNSAKLWLQWCEENETKFPLPIKRTWYSRGDWANTCRAHLQLDGLDSRVSFSCDEQGCAIFLDIELEPGRWAVMSNGFDERKRFKGIGKFDFAFDRDGVYQGDRQFFRQALLKEFPVWLEELKNFVHPEVAVYWARAEDRSGPYIAVNVLKWPPPILCALQSSELNSFVVYPNARKQLDVELPIYYVPNAYAVEPIDEISGKFILSPDYAGPLPNRKGLTFLLACGSMRLGLDRDNNSADVDERQPGGGTT